ncbi:MAG: hypothetical protein IPK19_12545 [Chloroflexi bacterium]|nr:hypothetical protein [Chloroflexota bacterium]
MQLRVVTEEMVLKTIRNPDRTYVEEDGDTKFIRKVNGVRVHVVCKPVPEENKWLIKSTWVRGEDDFGNRVDRYGRTQGTIRRAAPRTRMQRSAPSASREKLWIALLSGVLIVAVFVLVYLLSR